jgi:hypothetical protein
MILDFQALSCLPTLASLVVCLLLRSTHILLSILPMHSGRISYYARDGMAWWKVNNADVCTHLESVGSSNERCEAKDNMMTWR